MGVIFHRYQRETPETSGPDGSRSCITASLLHILGAIGIACLFTLVVRSGEFYFAICIWGALALPILLESAIFVRLHHLVVIGRLLDWLTTSVLARAIIWWCSSNNPLAAVETCLKLTCRPIVNSDKSEEHETCSSVYVRFPCTCIRKLCRLAPALSG